MSATAQDLGVSEFASRIGLNLDAQRSATLDEMCSVDDDGTWRFPRYGVSGGSDGVNVLEARALADLFLLDGRRVLWVSQNRTDARRSFERIVALIDASPKNLRQFFTRIRGVNGGECIELGNGSKLNFACPRAARGVSADTVLIDGLLSWRERTDLDPVMATAVNPQRVMRPGVARA